MKAGTEKGAGKSLCVMVRTTRAVIDGLDALAEQGLYGKSRSEIAEAFIREKLREAQKDGAPAKPTKTKASQTVATKKKKSGLEAYLEG